MTSPSVGEEMGKTKDWKFGKIQEISARVPTDRGVVVEAWENSRSRASKVVLGRTPPEVPKAS